MARENTRARADDSARDIAVEDARTERAVLEFLLEEHPDRLTLDELSLVMRADPQRDDPDDATGRAVRELVSAGLVHQDGRFVQPTRAATYFDRLRAG